MRRVFFAFIALWCIGGGQGFAQDKNDAIPLRFQSLAKNERFRLARILGDPELPPTGNPTSAFSADGKRAVYAEDLSSASEMKDQDKTKVELRLRTRLLLWDLQAKSWPREFEVAGKSVHALQMTTDGGKVLLAGDAIADKSSVARPYLSLWDLDAGKEIREVLVGEAKKVILCAALAPDETTALVGFVDGVQHWDLKQGKVLASYVGEANEHVTAVAFVPAGQQFLAGNRGGQVRLWEINKKKPVRTISRKGDKDDLVWWLSVSKDGKRFAAADLQSSVSLWDMGGGKEINTFRPEKRLADQWVSALALADDGKTVLSCWFRSVAGADDYNNARLIAWDGEANKTLWSHVVPYRGRLPILVQGEKLLIGGGPSLFETWSIKDGKRLESWGRHKGTVNAVAAVSNGDILSAGQDGVLLTWRKGQIAARRQGAVTALAMSRDHKHRLSAGAGQTIKLWSADKAMPIHVLKGHSGPVTSLSFSGNGRWACSGAGDRGVKTWDLATGKEIATLSGHSEGVNAVAISPDDRWLASASDDATIRLWPIKDGKLDLDREIITLEDHKKAVTCLAFAADGKTLVSGSQDQTLRVWDWAKEKVVRTIAGHKNWITSVLFIDANTFLSTSDDLSVCWWELDSGKEIGRVDFGSVGDCPRCLAHIGPDRLLVGTSSWLIYEFQMLPAAKSKEGAGSSK
jgi:WD40 repeat protein